jgi:hypothetical protein
MSAHRRRLRSCTGRAQESPAVAHVKRVLDLLGREKLEDLAKEFNGQAAAAMSASQLRDVWLIVHQRVGPFTSFMIGA